MNEWISVEDRLPGRHEKFLGYKDNGSTEVVLWWTQEAIDGNPYIFQNRKEPYFGDICVGNVTHWMSLPEPPKE